MRMPRSITRDESGIPVGIGPRRLIFDANDAIFVAQATRLTIGMELIPSGELPLKHIGQSFILKFNFSSPDEIRYRLFLAAGTRSISCLVCLLPTFGRILPSKSDGHGCS